ncbi:MAG: V-type ATP synthase subunit D [Thermotogae bacterium]|nr:V-type ATP synthase subunit D [Thermotogota bacterium]
MQRVSPTRMNLLIRKRQMKIAQQGADLLRKKRDALMKEFQKMLKPIVQAHRELDRTAREAITFLSLALGKDGPEAVRSAALSSMGRLKVKREEEKVWGVRIPKLKAEHVVRKSAERGYTLLSVSARIELTAMAYERLMAKIFELVPLEAKMKKIGQEIRKTSRRVNTLEQRVIPQLQAEMRFIRQVLEDREREDKFRLKRLKAKKEKKF